MRRPTLLTIGAIGVAALALSACSGDSMGNGGMGSGGMGGSGHQSSPTENAPSKVGQFRLYEWGITADSRQLPSGSQTITALNTGFHTHELIIVKAADAAALPTKSDGTVDEAALKSKTVGEIADVAAGSSKHATFALDPGAYVAFCNISDSMGMGMTHKHFELGMHTNLTVRSA